MQMYGARQGLRALPWAECEIFLKPFFICNNLNTNLNKNLPLFLFFQISARSRLKKFENEKWAKAGSLPLLD